ncbi:RNA methyltransferase [Desulfobotulus sp. H1]|uniref:RNA methyltransferase n=1 Tax=Desulfobotulus pelophilus TaxID=2823377 RepID=A0ABT3NBI3_9BACT|nr:RNA methyltransferase [Desulfobotulus pelophilus]MCW7754531.1 RNA methyltransferase [Desulfobotulus pelophilus]
MHVLPNPELYMALVHFPVINKNGETIASAVTNLDLHDMARSCRTYGVRGLFVVTPLEDQKRLVERISGHWTAGLGARHNPDRKEAFSLIRLSHDLEEAVLAVEKIHGQQPIVVVTTAKFSENAISHEALREILAGGQPCLLVFGTAWGLAESLLLSADKVLEPVRGTASYNHLSVRSAAAILLDRLVGHGLEGR